MSKPSGKEIKNHAAAIAQLFSCIESEKDLEALITDLFTPAERKDFWERWCIVDMLLKGKAQREIRDELKVSISKVTRGSRELQCGTGAFRRLWNKLHKK